MDANHARGLLTKCHQLNTSTGEHLNAVTAIVGELIAYADGVNSLDAAKLHAMTSELMAYTVLVPVPIPGMSGTAISRGVKYEGDSEANYAWTKRLSYIAEDSGITPPLNRFNPEGASMFYGCLGGNSNAIGAVLSECQARAGDIFYLLYSRTKTSTPESLDDINVVPIGVFDYLRRGVAIPFGLSNDYLQFYEALRLNTHPEGFLAMQLCDAFLCDILRRPGSPAVHSITAALATDCMQVPEIDGFLYPSTRLDGHPNLALKPSAVDGKLRHETAMSVRVERDLKYGMYVTKILCQGTVRDGVISWDQFEVGFVEPSRMKQ